jgi:hypothetical protein
MKTRHSKLMAMRSMGRSLALGAMLCLAAGIAAADCGSYTTVGTQCSRTVIFGWGAAGAGAQSVIAFVSRPAASGPVKFQVTQLNSSLGLSYSGYVGIAASANGAPASTYSGSTFPAVTLQPGTESLWTVSQVCFIATCNATAPVGAVANMFSMQLTITANSGADLDVTPLPLLTVQFITNGKVTVQEQEQALDVSSIPSSARAGLNEGASYAGRYFAINGAYTQPYTAFSVTNPSTGSALSTSIVLYDFLGNKLATVPLPVIPPQGAVAYLLVGRGPGDTLGLLPYGTLLPAGADGVFHGVYGVQASGPVVFLSQEFYGNSMLNAFIVK